MKNEHGLTPQQEVFAVALAAAAAGNGKSQSDAFRMAYPRSLGWKPETVHQSASRLAANPMVSARAQALLAAAADRAELEAAEIMRETRRLALSNPAGIMNADGTVKLPHELDRATAACIASFEIDELGRIKYKFWDKNSALERAAKILGLFERDNEQKNDPLSRLLAGLKGNVVLPAPGAAAPDDGDDDDDAEVIPQ